MKQKYASMFLSTGTEKLNYILYNPNVLPLMY